MKIISFLRNDFKGGSFRSQNPYISRIKTEYRNTRSYESDLDHNEDQHGASSLALHKLPGSTRILIPSSDQQPHFPLTKGYLNAANRQLAASTLKLWQGGANGNLLAGDLSKTKRKTKSVYNLEDCMV